jgi:hypothetical protein
MTINISSTNDQTCAFGGTWPDSCNGPSNNGICVNGATNPPLCNTNTTVGTCANGATDPPNCASNANKRTCSYGGTWPNCVGLTNNGNGNNGTINNGNGNNGNIYNGTNNNRIINTNNANPLVLGQMIAPPVDDVVRYHEGIETVFTRQIMADNAFAIMYGYQAGTDLQTFAWNLADQLARAFGYVSANGKEIRVSLPDVAAYQLQLVGNKLTVYEYYNNKIVDVRNLTTVFKNASGYEYYFQKN